MVQTQTPEAPLVSLEQHQDIRDMLEAQWTEGKFLCVGLDVALDEGEHGPMALYDKARAIVDATKDVAAMYKPNDAFYARYGSEGVRQLEQLAVYIHRVAPDVPIDWDAKRADIANTNEGYSDAAENMGMDAMTIHPYLGGTAVEPLLDDPDMAGFVLVHTSNPGAAEIQHLELKSGEKLWERVGHNVAHSEDWSHGSVLGVVAGATYPGELAKTRHIVGDDVVMLVPGIGKQGGDLEAAVRGAMNSRGNGFVINVSSGISGAKDEKGDVTPESIRDAAVKYHKQIKEIWQDALANPRPSYGELQITEFDAKLAKALFDEGCVNFGRFTLRDGSESPVYVDMRNSITDPTLRGNIAQIYVDLIKAMEDRRGEPFDLIGSIPEASTAYGTIVAERLGKRLIQPRSAKKVHGVAAEVIGKFKEGESVGLVDDLITSGGAKFDTIAQLEGAGLKFGGVALLLDREQGGSREMSRRGYTFNYASTAKALIKALGETGQITPERTEEVLNFLNK